MFEEVTIDPMRTTGVGAELRRFNPASPRLSFDPCLTVPGAVDSFKLSMHFISTHSTC
jgi:hypothetical protein